MADEEKLSFLDKEEAPEPVEEQVEASEPEAEPAPEPEPEPEPTGEDAAPPAASHERQQPVPITALLDEREKRQAEARRAEQAEQRLRQLEAQIRAQQEKRPAPDWYEDPQAAAQYQQQNFQQAMLQQTLRQSRFFAEKEYGAELVEETNKWFDENPQLSHQFIDKPSPWHAAVEFYKRQKLASEVGSDPDAYRERLREEIRQELLNEVPTTSKPKAPPPSMSKAPSSGRDSITPGSTFDTMFG